MHAEFSSVSWAMVAQLLGPGDPGRSPLIDTVNSYHQTQLTMSRQPLLLAFPFLFVVFLSACVNADELAELRSKNLQLTKLLNAAKNEVIELRKQVDQLMQTSFQVALPAGQPDTNAPVHEGVWKAISASFCGQHFSADALRGWFIKIADGQYTQRVKGNDQLAIGIVEINESVKPKRMTIKLMDGNGKVKTVNAIYEIRNQNVLILCYSYHGKDDSFPTEFKSVVDPPTHLTVFLRETQRAGP